MGMMKVLLPWHGQLLIRHIAQVALAARLEQVIVVTGNEAMAVAQAVQDLPVDVVHNDRYRDGLSGSLRVGIAALGPEIAAALVMLGDQPLLTAAVINQLVERYEQGGASIVAPFADGQRGNPVLFDRKFFAELQAIAGDQGARTVLQTYRDAIVAVEVDSAVLEDVDTPEAYEALLARTARNGE
jgi:molybdenum cofactor cytidylyltransferase